MKLHLYTYFVITCKPGIITRRDYIIYMKSKRSQGFTLIELLVVIAIIGLLASIILASLTTAQQKGRDARRVGDLHEIGQAMVAADSGSGTTITGCTTAPCRVALLSGTGLNVSNYTDPAGSTTACAKSPSLVATCDYSEVVSAPTTQTYEICDYLEAGSGSLGKGSIYVAASSSGSVLQGCP
jgi:prepilin-type N-terminal cleavage/methylation domain-containing protein